MTATPDPNEKLQTISIHSGRHVDPATGSVTAPLYTSTTFERDPNGEFSRHFFYSRIDNPNRKSLEECLADLEGGVEAVAFGTGMAASLAVFQALAPGNHVVLHRDLYFGVRELVTSIFSRWGLQHTFADMRNAEELRRACRAETRLLWLETPTNPLIEVVAIEPVVELARTLKIPLVCENTFATPVLQNPLKLGADMVVVALTKYIAGHSDALGGAVIFGQKSDLTGRIKDFQRVGGAVLSPFDCWLILRGAQTLVPRVRLHCENARRVAEFLSTHPAVSAVHYPGLATDPGHAIAKKQMRDFGGMVSFEIRGGRQEAFAMTSRLKLITRATSLGGTHSLIEHRASIEGVFSRSPESLLRFSVGLEGAEDIIADLDQALRATILG
jgi:cystathionine gamma-synthase